VFEGEYKEEVLLEWLEDYLFLRVIEIKDKSSFQKFISKKN